MQVEAIPQSLPTTERMFDATAAAIPASDIQPSAAVADNNQEQRLNADAFLQKVQALTDDGDYSVRFEIDQKTRQLVIRLVDGQSGELIRQIPPDELLDVSAHLAKLRGSLVDTAG